MATINTDILPNRTGQNLGSPDQEWDGFFKDLQATNVIFDGVAVSTGDAKSLQGVPIDATAPAITEVLTFDGAQWTHSSTVISGNATQLQGRPLSAGAPALNQAIIWDGAQWAPANQSGGGGGGATLGYVSVGFSATPTFTPSPVGACAFEITLTGNVTSSTFTTAGLTSGALMTFIINQDSTGFRSFVWPTSFHGAMIIGGLPSQTSAQQFLYNGTVFNAINLGVTYP